jgi:hypothetical protein
MTHATDRALVRGLMLIVAIASSAPAAIVPTRYLVDEGALKKTEAGSGLEFELYDDPSCAIPIATSVVDIADVTVKARVSTYKLKKGPKPLKLVELQHTFVASPTAGASLFVRVTGGGIDSSAVGQCQAQPPFGAASPVTISAGSYSPTWTTVKGFQNTPSLSTAEYSRVGNLVTVVAFLTGPAPSYAPGTNIATLTVPPGLPVGGPLVSGTFSSDHYRVESETVVGIVARSLQNDIFDPNTVLLQINGSAISAADSWCNFTYQTSAP